MNIYEEAKITLEQVFECDMKPLYATRRNGKTRVVEAFKIAIEALELAKEEKHIAKKVVNPKSNAFNLIVEASCPNCGNYVTRANLYCRHCGQELDSNWEVNNNDL